MRCEDLGQAVELIAADPVTLDDPTLRDRLLDLAGLANHRYAEAVRAVDTFDRRGHEHRRRV